MRIAYIGNFRVPFSTESHVAQALEELGHHVVRHDEEHVDWRWVPHHAAASGTGMVLWTHTHGYAPEAKHDDCQAMLDGLAAHGIPSVAFHLDRWWGLEREHQVHEPFFRCDLVVTADGGHDAGWARLGVNHVWMPPAVVASEVGRGTFQSRYAKDVGFVGSWQHYGHHAVWPWRFEVVSAVARRYGSRFRAWPRAGEPLRGQALNDVYASVKVLLGDSCLAGGATRYISDRVPETLGRGGFLLHPRVEGVTDGTHYTEGEHIACYDVGDIDEVCQQIDRYVRDDDERERITTQAIEHVRERHTYTVRMRDVIALVEGLRRGGV